MKFKAIPSVFGGGNNVALTSGVTQIQPTQLGFPAVLTSAWDTLTAYSWKRMLLTAVTVGNPSLQETGDHAVTPDNNTGLMAGAQGWMEPDPHAGGWFFLLGLRPAGCCGSGSGSGSGTDCGITPVSVACVEGQRTLTLTTFAVSQDSTGALILSACGTTDTALGPCSSLIPGGSPSAPIINICITAPALTAPTSDYTINYDDHLVTPNGPSITVKLPVIDPLRPPGADIFNIKNLNATAATLSGNGALIDGAATKTLVQYASVTVWTDGTNWFIE